MVRPDDYFLQKWFKCDIEDPKKERCDPKNSFVELVPDCKCKRPEVDNKDYNQFYDSESEDDYSRFL